jgi:hypothetical protein
MGEVGGVSLQDAMNSAMSAAHRVNFVSIIKKSILVFNGWKRQNVIAPLKTFLFFFYFIGREIKLFVSLPSLWEGLGMGVKFR